MKIRTNPSVAAALIAALILSSFTFVLADEGMYAPGQIASLPLGKAGIKIKAEEIYNPAGGGLADAVIRLSIGCTASFVSPDGLILTNHHCGFDALVSASTPEKDLVETGFNAGSRSGEIEAKDYSIFITNRVEDVTAKVRARTEGLSGDALTAALQKNLTDLQTAEQAKAKPGAQVRIQMLNSGYFYYLYETQQIRDIRVVYAPPRTIGVFGGDPDNFEWTRHTGDYTFLRAYVAPDGSSAAYSANNVPFKPKKFLTVSIAPQKENDAVFVLGYPGGTTRYRESWSMIYARDANFPFLERWLTELADTLREIGATDEDKRIAFQSDIANYDNSRKAFGGGHLQLKRVNAVQKRQAEEAQLATWIAADPERRSKWGNVLPEIRTLSEETNAAQKRDVIMRRFPDQISMPVFGQIVAAGAAVKAGRRLTEQQRGAIAEALKDREPYLEREMLKFFLRDLDELPANQRFAAADKKFGSETTKGRREIEAAYAEQVATGEFTNPAKIAELYSLSWADFQRQHPFAAGVVDEKAALAARTAKFNANIDRLRLPYIQALTEMKRMPLVYPDANSSLRFSHGYIKGYQSREAELRFPFTTIKGMIEKDTGVKPFDVPQKLVDLQNARDFGQYGEGDSVVVNFLSTTDIIGGNSGSPIFNARGEVVGLCFDGNFEGLGNDFYYDTEKTARSRSICVSCCSSPKSSAVQNGSSTK